MAYEIEFEGFPKGILEVQEHIVTLLDSFAKGLTLIEAKKFVVYSSTNDGHTYLSVTIEGVFNGKELKVENLPLIVALKGNSYSISLPDANSFEAGIVETYRQMLSK